MTADTNENRTASTEMLSDRRSDCFGSLRVVDVQRDQAASELQVGNVGGVEVPRRTAQFEVGHRRQHGDAGRQVGRAGVKLIWSTLRAKER